MGIFQRKILTCLLFCLSVWLNSADAYYDGRAEVKVDGLNNTVAVWVVKESNLLKLRGTYDSGSPWSNNDITNILIEELVDYPALDTSKDPEAATKAVVIWLSRAVLNSRIDLKASVYSNGSWSPPQIISSNPADPNEFIRSDYTVAISEDGDYISAVWTSLYTNTGQNILRSAISTDGGSNWTTTDIEILGSVY